ncbi:hypothetical protein GIB67_000369 [Kingdonia uniflora]|uniref:RRM domain-containing protein n=1 Tax=Kingdonia uniflora TaxID=39325 RepID=A0A7J7LKG2_9MAGN|nr:hypothetical protein GIB67_000369 [Kingdonia uniflora]
MDPDKVKEIISDLQRKWGSVSKSQQASTMITEDPEYRTLWLEICNHISMKACLEVRSIKISRGRLSEQPGYGFVEFASHAVAERMLHKFNGTRIPGTLHIFKLRWAYFEGIGKGCTDAGPGHSICVGDLASDVPDCFLQEMFRFKYPLFTAAKVVIDPSTGCSKSYEFVKFVDELERNRAISEMNGVYCSSRPMRISTAFRKFAGCQQTYTTAVKNLSASTTPAAQLMSAPDNENNDKTIFIDGLDPKITNEELRQILSQFGELVHVEIQWGKRCGRIQFS